MAKGSDRVESLIRRMSVQEKIAQLCAAWIQIEPDGTLKLKSLVGKTGGTQESLDLLRDGIGQLTRPHGTHPIEPTACKREMLKLQRYLVEHTPLGIPAILHEECLAGMMASGMTQFPTGINHGASWDPDLTRRVGEAIHREMRAAGVHQGLAPVLDVSRDARWGRTEESMGEDPYLVGVQASSYVRGLQGESQSILATLKHFLGHSMSEGGRNHAPVHVGPRELNDIFALPFEMAIKLANARSVMPAYHDIDGEPLSASIGYLRTLLREKWGFDGLLVSDYEGISQLCHDHHIARDMAEAAALALRAGMDMELPSDTAYRHGLLAALEQNLITVEDLDEAVRRVLREKERIGLFDRPYGETETSIVDHDAHHELAIEAAVSSAVLLENNGILPLRAGNRIALIGPLADEPYAMFAGYSFPTHLIGPHSKGETIPVRAMTIRQALEQSFGGDWVSYARGCSIIKQRSGKEVVFPGEVVDDAGPYAFVLDEDVSGIGEAVDLARKSDVAVVVLGDLAGLFRNGTVGEGSDASSLQLPGVQSRLLGALNEAGKPIVLVLVSGRPYDLCVDGHQSDAVLALWMPGEGGSEALVRMLRGDACPGGRLPISYVTDAGMLPYVYNHVQKSGGVPVHPDFRCVYPFGYGLSYTRFAHTDIRVEQSEQPMDGTFTISLSVENIGEIPGVDVIQLYVHDELASIVRPVVQLKGYQKIHLEPHQSRVLKFSLPVDMLHISTEDLDRVVEPGEFTLMLASSAQDIWYTHRVSVVGTARKLGRDWRMVTNITVI